MRRLGDYCLKCFANLPRTAEECSACGHPVRAHEQQRYWSLHPRHLALQRTLRNAVLVASSLLGAILLYLMLTTEAADLETGGRILGVFVLFPFVPAALALEHIALLTRHARLRLGLIWIALLASLGGLAVAAGITYDAPRVAVIAVAVFSALVIAGWLIRRMFLSWKARWIDGRAHVNGLAPETAS